MPAYMIAEVQEILDLAMFRQYNSIVPGTIEKHGGRFLVRGGASETIEGRWTPDRLVVVEFDTMAALRRWYKSADYQQAQPMRERSARSNVVFVEGALDPVGTGGAA